jgi:hypothetical protein
MDMDTYFFFVRAWAAPEQYDALRSWLCGGHPAELIAQPGGQSAWVVDLEERSPEGWQGFMTVYSWDSKEAFDAFMNSEERIRLEGQAGQFGDGVAVERHTGSLAAQFTGTSEPVPAASGH